MTSTITPIETPIETIRKKIEFLGSECPTPGDVATFFQGLGIKGKPGEARSCPVAVWLEKFLVRDDYLIVGTFGSGWVGELKRSAPEHNIWDHFAAHPEQVVEFIQNFDTGAYPDLVA